MADLRAALVASTLVLALAGCTHPTPIEERPAGRSTTVSTPPPVRTESAPITKRFPRLGDVSDLHWQSATLGSGSRTVPGPTDVRIRALAVLRPATLASATARYEWKPAPPGWGTKVSSELRPFLPADGTWQVSEQFDTDVLPDGYGGGVYLDTTSGTVFIDVVSS